ncbi:MAG: hypothetical protein Q9210_004558 [Variospora velana]
MRFCSFATLFGAISSLAAVGPANLEQPRDQDAPPRPSKHGTNKALDLQNPDNLASQGTDNGIVPNLKWSFSRFQDEDFPRRRNGAMSTRRKSVSLLWMKTARIKPMTYKWETSSTFPKDRRTQFKLSQLKTPPAPGGGGTLAKFDSRSFPIATTIAAATVALERKGLRELHGHPDSSSTSTKSKLAPLSFWVDPLLAPLTSEPVIFTAVFPDNSGHYIENTSETEQLIWIELYKERPCGGPSTLKIFRSVVDQLKKEKQSVVDCCEK